LSEGPDSLGQPDVSSSEGTSGTREKVVSTTVNIASTSVESTSSLSGAADPERSRDDSKDSDSSAAPVTSNNRDQDILGDPGQHPDLTDARELGQWTSRFCRCAQKIINKEKKRLFKIGFVSLFICIVVLGACKGSRWYYTSPEVEAQIKELQNPLAKSASSIQSPPLATNNRTPSQSNSETETKVSKSELNSAQIFRTAFGLNVFSNFACVVAGIFGGLVAGLAFAIKWLNHSVAKGTWNIDRHLWRVNTPLTSAAFAGVIVVLIRSGLFNLLSPASVEGWSACFGIGFLTGYFSDNAIAKMNELAIAMFGTNPTDRRTITGKERDQPQKHFVQEEQRVRQFLPRCKDCPLLNSFEVKECYRPITIYCDDLKIKDCD
jgi:hypothetical protein